jgi:hypothetical protein
MDKTRIWIKDELDSGQLKFEEDQIVIVYRRKKNGYPSHIEDGKLYKVIKINGDILYLIIPNISIDNGISREFKVHRTFVIPIYYLRNEIINEILQ